MPTKSRVPTKRGEVLCAVAIAIVLLMHTAAVAVGFGCSCSVCCAGGSCGRTVLYEPGTPATALASGSNASEAFQVISPWTFTATDGFRGIGTTGTPVTLTWGFVNDGTNIFDMGSAEGSSLISSLNNAFGSPPTGDVQQAPWFSLFEDTFGRWAELSGITYNFESADNGTSIGTTGGVLGQNADVRIGGRSIEREEGNVLAFNFFPNVGDMVIDTDDLVPGGFLTNPDNNFRALRNVIAHEIGHGLGIAHLESSDSFQLLEPFLTLAVDGPQIAEILTVHRLYGDALEVGGGNDTAATAEAIGSFGGGDSFALGTDGDTLIVTPDQTDFVSIDGTGDTDLYRFTVDEAVLADLDLTQVGRSYNAGPEGSEAQVLVDNALRNALQLELLTLDDNGVLVSAAEATSRGDAVSRGIDDLLLLPGGEYFVRVTGTIDDVQLYELGLSFAAVAVPEPSGVSLALLAAAACFGRRRLDATGCREA